MSSSLKDIAVLVGVADSTVSRVLNDAPMRISEKRRKVILETARKLNYVPNRLARTLRTGRHDMIGILAYDITDAFAAECVTAMDSLSQREGYRNLWASCVHAEAAHTDPFRLLADVAQIVDGIVIIAANRYIRDSDIVRFKQQYHVPVVTLTRSAPTASVPSVSIDDRHGTLLLLEYLVSLGHRRIAFCYRNQPHPAVAMRYDTYKQFICEHNLDQDESLCVAVDGTGEDGFRAGMKLLKLSRPPTAIIGFNDLTAVGLIQACYHQQVRIPHDVSIVGFDNIRLTKLTTPTLTSVGASFSELVGTAFKELMVRSSSDHSGGNQAVAHFITPELFIRESSGLVASAVQ